MQVGLMAPQGWKGEYDGWAAGRRLGPDRRAGASRPRRSGSSRSGSSTTSTPCPTPTDEITFESFSVLSALAMATERVRLGHMVVCTGFRNPALTAKLSSTIDVISGGRFELGIGAGWKEEEWRAYGYGFPTLGERMAALGDHLEVIHAMFGPGRATLRGPRSPTSGGAINVPEGPPGAADPDHRRRQRRAGDGRLRDPLRGRAQLRVPRRRTRCAERMAAVRARCEAEGRDPATLRFSLYTRDEEMRDAGPGAGRRPRAAARRSGSTGSSASRRAGRRRSRRRRAFAEDCRAAGRRRSPALARRVSLRRTAQASAREPTASRIRPIRRSGA